MKKILALVTLLLVVVTSCSEDDNINTSTTNPPANDLRLVRMDVGYVGPDDPYQYLEYVYDADGRVDKVLSQSSDGSGETAVSDYEYTDGRVVNINYSNGTNRTYAYQGDRIVFSEHNGTTYDYGYDTFGRLESITRSQSGTDGCVTTMVYGGTSQPEQMIDGCTQSTYTFEYDDKKNPEYYLFHASFSKSVPLTPNNVMGYTAQTGNPEDDIVTTEMTYNDQGWPTSKRYFVNGTFTSENRYYYEEP